MDEFYDSSDTSWYDRPMKKRTALMISSFKLGEHIITTFAVPIIYAGKAIGVINADIDVTSLQSRLEKIGGTSKENFKILCSTDGTVVAHGANS